MRGTAGALTVALAWSIALPANADDVDLIPQAVRQAAPAAAAPSAPAAKLSLEDALTAWSLRDPVVPLPGGASVDARNRTSLDLRGRWRLQDDLELSLSDRLSLVEQNDFAFPSSQSPRNDWREGYLTWEPAPRAYLEAGRINLRNGVALGFNPTDFFKTRSLVDQISQDPSALRENRLGTLMLHGQTIWDGGSASAAFAPRLYDPTPVQTAPGAGLRAGLDRTNASDRVLLSGSVELADLNPQLLLYHDGDATRLGLNLSRVVGKSVVLYAEWAGGRYPNLITRALAYGRATGTLPANAPPVLPTDPQSAFQNDLALGLSWTGAAKLTVNAEYLYHQAGLSRADWRNWFATGTAQAGSLPVTGALWYIRAWAADQQEPMTREQLFLRAAWSDAFVPHLELSGFALVNLYDRSRLVQFGASYYLSDRWTLGAFLSANVGTADSERGSLPQARSAVLQALYYF
ncbi:MAG TPA: hypothetical protein VLX30_11510 [Burkholderiales bacterium]|nr:hypothetical protein [Burkholderiales bacterium]